MAKKVKLLWKNDKSRLIIEECLLMEEADTIFDGEGNPAPADIWEALQGTGNVVFEDEHGIFLLPPESIIQMDILEGEQL